MRLSKDSAQIERGVEVVADNPDHCWRNSAGEWVTDGSILLETGNEGCFVEQDLCFAHEDMA